MPTPDFVLALRGKVGHDLLPMCGVTGVVLDGERRLLLGRRADNGRWSIPSGILEPGEQPATAVLREIEEETGVVVAVEALTSTHAATGGLSQRRPGAVPGPVLPLPLRQRCRPGQ